MNVLVTGASGFLGSYLVGACVERGYNVRVLVRRNSSIEHLKSYPSLDYVYGDLSDPAAVSNACGDMEVVLHSAARASQWGSWKQFYIANELGTRNVVDSCLKNHVRRLVYVSSPSIVFDYKDHFNIDESYPIPSKAANYYCMTKANAERYALAFHGTNGLSTIIVRPHAIWGPGDKTGPIPQLLSQVTTGRLKRITDGKKDVTLDLCHVKNATHACMLAAQVPRGGGTYFVTDGEHLKLWECMDILCDAMGLNRLSKTISPRIAMAAGSVIETVWKLLFLEDKYKPPLTRYVVGLLTCSTTYNIEAARRDLGYAPLIDFKTGVEQLKEWINKIGGLHEFIKYA